MEPSYAKVQLDGAFYESPYSKVTLDLLFESESIFKDRVSKYRKEGMDDDFVARQIVDDVFRETGRSYHLCQGQVENLVKLVPIGLFIYRLCWDRVTAESCVDGDTDGNGFVIDGERVQLDHKNIPSKESVSSQPFDSLQELLADVEEYGPWLEWSCMPPCGPKHCWLNSDEHGTLDEDDEVFNYSLFVKQADGSDLTQNQFNELVKLAK